MSGEPEDFDDWQDTTNAPEGLNGLPEATAPERPADAVEPPHVPIVADDDDEAEPRGRDDGGRFKPRHRARSQQAGPDDVATISALTKRIKDAEAAEGADIAQQPGESQRVYELRRRAEVLERRTKAAAPATPASQPGPASTSPQPSAPPPSARVAAQPVHDPEPDPDAVDDDGKSVYADGQYDRKFMNDHARWAARDEYRKVTADTEKTQAEQTRLQGFARSVDAARIKYADFDAVAFGPTPTGIADGSAVDVFIMEDESGAEVLYHLRKNPAELNAILGQPVLKQLKTLSLLSQRLTSPSVPAQAGTTGSAAAPAHTTTPRPPNPVRHTAIHASTEPPGDDDSLEAHERHYYGSRR